MERNTSVRVRETLQQSYWHSNFPRPIDMLTSTSRLFTNFLTAFVWCSSRLRCLVSCTPPQSLSFHAKFTVAINPIYDVTFANQSNCSANIPAERTKVEYSVHQTIFPSACEKWSGGTRLDRTVNVHSRRIFTVGEKTRVAGGEESGAGGEES